MTVHYTEHDARRLQGRWKQQGEAIDLVLCSDGVMRTAAESADRERDERAAEGK